MPDNSRLNSSQEQSTIEKLRASYLPQMPFPAKNNTTVQLNGEVEKSQETFKAELNNISSLIQTLEKNPQDLELRAQISTRLTNAVSTAAASMPLPDCERMMQNYGIRTYWEDMKAGKTTLTDQNKDLNQAQLHQEQQAVLTAQQIAQIKQQAAKDYDDFWRNHNNIDYAHASAAEIEKWRKDNIKMSYQWAKGYDQVVETKPFNEAKLILQERDKKRIKDIEEQDKKISAALKDSNLSEEQRKKLLQAQSMLRKEKQIYEEHLTNVTTSQNSEGLKKANETQQEKIRNLYDKGNQATKEVNQALTNQSQEEISENNRTVTVADNRERKQAISLSENYADTVQLKQQAIKEAIAQKADNTQDSREAIGSAQKSISLSAALNTLVRDESRTTLSSDTTAAQELRNVAEALKTSNATSRPDAQNMGTLLSALNLDTSQEGENKNIVMSSTAEKENTPNTSDKPKEISLAAVLKDMNTPPAPEVEKTASAEPVVQAPTLPNEQKGASAEQTVQNTTPQNAESASHTLSEPNAVKAPNKPTDLSALLAASSGKLGTENQVRLQMDQNTMC